MSTPIDRRRRWFLISATAILPLVNPPLFIAAIVYLGDERTGVLACAALVIAALDWLALTPLARRAWPDPGERRRRLLAGVAAAAALGVLYGFVEVYALIVILCSGGGCD